MNIEITNYDLLKRFYSMCTVKDNPKHQSLAFENDEERLFFAKCLYTTPMSKRYKCWGIDWGFFNLKGTNTDKLWAELQEEVDGIRCINVKKALRKKTVQPKPELFDKPLDSWIDPDKTDIENIDIIYNTHNKIVHRDIVLEYLAKTTPSKQQADSKNVEYLKAKMLALRLTVDECVAVQKYIGHSLANKTKMHSTVSMLVPDHIKLQAEVISRQPFSWTKNLINDPDKNLELIRAGILGFSVNALTWDFDKEGEAVFRTDPPAFFADYLKDKGKNKPTTNVGLSVLRKDIGFARCLHLMSKSAKAVQYRKENITSICVPLRGSVGEHVTLAGVPFGSYIQAIKRPWGEHKEQIKDFLNNLQPYHVCRPSNTDPWEFNYSAMSIELLEQGIPVHPDLLRWLSLNQPALAYERAQEIGYGI